MEGQPPYLDEDELTPQRGIRELLSKAQRDPVVRVAALVVVVLLQVCRDRSTVRHREPGDLAPCPSTTLGACSRAARRGLLHNTTINYSFPDPI